MARMHFLPAIALAAIAAASCSPSDKQADLQPFTDAVIAQFAANGLELSIDNAKPDGNDIVLTGVEIGAPGTVPAKLDEIRLQDVKEQESGYRITAIRAPEFSHAAEGATLEFKGADFRGIFISKAGTNDPMAKSLLMESARFESIRAQDEAGEVFRMASASFEASPYSPGKPLKYTIQINGIEADMSKLPDARTRDMIAALGYAQLRGSVSGSGSWNPNGGRSVMNDLVYKVEDAAQLSVSMDISGITPQFIAAMQDLNERQAAGDTSSQLSGLAYMGLMQQLVFNRLKIRFEDASLTNKVLDFMAEQRGATRADMISQAKGILPAMLMQLRNPVFATRVAEAVGAYLDDPKSLTIAAEPAKPVAAPMLMATGMAAPQSLPEILGVTVKAND